MKALQRLNDPEDQQLLASMRTNRNFCNAIESFATKIDLEQAVAESNSRQEEINERRRLLTGWWYFDGEYVNTEMVHDDGWPVQKFKEPVYPLRSYVVEDLVDHLLHSTNLCANRFNQLPMLRRFRKMLQSTSNADRAYCIGMMIKGDKFIEFFKPCDLITYNWWIRLYLDYRTLEMIKIIRFKFEDEKWEKRIAYTLYIYRFRPGLKGWLFVKRNLKSMLKK